MRIITEPEKIRWDGPTVLTLGKFDGLHRGHQTLIRRVKEKAEELDAAALVLSFSVSNEFLLSPLEKRKMLGEMGMDGHLEIPLTPAIASMEAEDFVRDILVSRLRIRHLVASEDFRFGHGRRGDTALLLKLGRDMGFGLDVLPKLGEGGERISSTRVRGHILAGQMEEAGELLGYPYFVTGEIVHGRRIGRTIGFPTTNLLPERGKVLPPKGVYFVHARILGEVYPGIANLGTKPTVNGDFVGIETHLLGLAEELYGQTQKVELLHYHRPEKRFPDLDTLRRQIEDDRRAALRYFGRNVPEDPAAAL